MRILTVVGLGAVLLACGLTLTGCSNGQNSQQSQSQVISAVKGGVGQPPASMMAAIAAGKAMAAKQAQMKARAAQQHH